MHDTLDYMRQRPGAPALPPPPDDLRHASTPSPRTSSCRSATTRWCTARARCSARCRATAGRSSPISAPISASCGRIPARSCSSWAASSRQEREWNHDHSLDWHLLADPMHRGVQALVRDLNRLYRELPGAARQRDCDAGRLRMGRCAATPTTASTPILRYGEPATRRCSSSATSRRSCATATGVGVPRAGAWRERLNTDAARYGGSNVGNAGGWSAERTPLARPPGLASPDAAAARDDDLRARRIGARPHSWRSLACRARPRPIRSARPGTAAA